MRVNRIKLVERLWLVAACTAGVVVAAILWGRPTKADLELQNNRELFASMPAEKQLLIRKNYSAWRPVIAPSAGSPESGPLAEERKKALEQLHAAVEGDPELQKKLDLFTEWWASVSTADRNTLQSLIREQDAKAISSRIFDDQQKSGNLIVDFSHGPFRFSRQFIGMRSRPENSGIPESLPTLELTPKQYHNLLDHAYPESSLSPEQQRELAALTSQDEKLLYRTLQALFSLRESNAASAFDRLSPLIDALSTLTVEWDSEWAAKYTDRVKHGRLSPGGDRNPRLLINRINVIIDSVSVLDQAVIDFGGAVRANFVASDSELVDAFASASDEERQRVMLLNPDLARDQLQKLAILSHHMEDSAQLRLYRGLLAYDDALMSYHRLFSFRPGPPPGQGGGPDRFNSGRDGRDERDRSGDDRRSPPQRPE